MDNSSKSKAELLKYIQELEDVIEKNPMSTQIVDKEGFTLSVNAAHTMLFGAVPPPDFSIFADLQNNQPELEQFILRAKGGEVVQLPDIYYNVHDLYSDLPDNPVWINAVIVPIAVKDGKPERFVLMHENISKRKQEEKDLRFSKDFLERIINSIASPVFVKDGKHIFCLVNNAFCTLLGLPVEKIIGTSGYEYFPDEQMKVFIARDQDVFNTGKENVNEEFLTDGHGNIRTIITKKTLYTDHTGNKFLVGIINDITDREQAEAEIQLMNKELILANAQKDKFFSIIAHDLRSPFNNFLGLSQIMAEDLPHLTMDEIQKIAVSIRTSANNLYRLLENLLQWSKMEQGLIPFLPADLKLLDVVNESIRIVLEPSKNKEIDLVNDIQDSIMVFADSNMLQTVIRNIVSNAVKFTPRGGKIHLSAKATGDKNIEISIKDSGIGMSSAILDNLFRLDFQTNRKGTENESSTGLGLIICKDFIEKLGGRLLVESQEGKGSDFKITLPALN